MSREVRMVKPGWEHPKDERGRYVGLLKGYTKKLSEWEEEKSRWYNGYVRDYLGERWKPKDGHEGSSFTEWCGDRSKREHYMPEWSPEEATLLVMYETTSEGTPISPAFETPEELARWLTDNNASAFGDRRASYEDWLRVCYSGWAPSAIVVGGEIVSGVEGVARLEKQKS